MLVALSWDFVGSADRWRIPGSEVAPRGLSVVLKSNLALDDNPYAGKAARSPQVSPSGGKPT